MQTKWSHTKISPFGGIVPILRKLQELKIPELIGSCLGQRVKQAKYSNESILISWVLTQLTSGFRLLKIEDAEKEFSSIPDLNIPSHDTMGRFFKKLATPVEEIDYRNPRKPNEGIKHYRVNENPMLNELLIQAAISIGALKKDTPYTLDIDATLLESETREACFTYKNFYGFNAMVCTIGKVVVYVDLKSGNAAASYRLTESLKTCLSMLKKHGITIDRVRSDGAGYQNKFLDYIDSEGIKFNVGADGSKRAVDILAHAKNWRKIEFKTSETIWDAEIASAHYQLSHSDKKYILAVMRVKENKKNHVRHPAKWKLIDGYYYKFVVTNDEEISPKRIFEEYHQRGASEKVFDELKNDFGWRILPFSKMNENLVYLQLTAFTSIVYQGLLQIYSKEFEKIKPTIRLEKFKKEFIRAFAFAYVEGVFMFYGADLDFRKIV